MWGALWSSLITWHLNNYDCAFLISLLISFIFLWRLMNQVMNSLGLSHNQEQVKNNFRRKHHVDIKAMFRNGCCNHLSLPKHPFKKKINSWIMNNTGVLKTVFSKVSPSELPNSCCWTLNYWNIELW